MCVREDKSGQTKYVACPWPPERHIGAFSDLTSHRQDNICHPKLLESKSASWCDSAIVKVWLGSGTKMIWLGSGLEIVLWVTMTALFKFREFACQALEKKKYRLSVGDGGRTDPFIHPDLLPMQTLSNISLRCGSARKNCSQKMFLSVL